MTTKYTAAVGISLSSLAPGSSVVCRTIDVPGNSEETTQEHESIHSSSQSSLESALKNLNIPPNSYIVVTFPIYFTEEEERVVRDTFKELSYVDKRFSAYVVMTHENLFRRIIASSHPDQPLHNEMVLNIGPERTVCRVVRTDTEEGVSESREIARVECGSSVEEIEKCVRAVKDSVKSAPSDEVAGVKIGRVLTTHLPAAESKTLVAELLEQRLVGLLPESTEYKTTGEPEVQAAREAVRRILESRNLLCTFSMSVVRLGIELEDGSVYGVIPKHVTLPQSREVDLRTTAESASVRVVVGGPRKRVSLGTVKVEGVGSGKKLRVQVNVDGDMKVRLVVREVSEDGQSGRVVGEEDMGDMLAGLRDEEVNKIVSKDENLAGQVDLAVEDGRLPA